MGRKVNDVVEIKVLDECFAKLVIDEGFSTDKAANRFDFFSGIGQTRKGEGSLAAGLSIGKVNFQVVVTTGKGSGKDIEIFWGGCTEVCQA